MLCLACASIGHPLCPRCEGGLRSAPSVIAAGVPVHAAFMHTGAAARLVHNLKYRRSTQAGRFLAREMAGRIPEGVEMLVPLPRVSWRRVVNGIDQTAVLARCLSELTGIAVVTALAPPIWHRRLAGTGRVGRVGPRFKPGKNVSGTVCFVDDVCTTGATLASAIGSLPCANPVAVVATLAVHQSVVVGLPPISSDS